MDKKIIIFALIILSTVIFAMDKQEINSTKVIDSESFIPLLVSLLGSVEGHCAKEILEFAKNNFNSKDMKMLLTYKDSEYGRTLLLNAVKISNNSELVALILDLANKNLSDKKKNSLINTTEKKEVAGYKRSALYWAWDNKFHKEQPAEKAEAEKIIDLLKKNGAIEQISD